MKIILILFLLFFTIVVYAQDYYIVNIREYITNYNNNFYPYIDCFLKSSFDSSVSITFNLNLYKLIPSNFSLSLDSLIINGNIKQRIIIGDNNIQIPDFLNTRGIYIESKINKLSTVFLTGLSKDIIPHEYPTYIHNKYTTMIMTKFNMFNTDTTGFFFLQRNDDDYYNSFIIKKYFGIYHNSIIGERLHLSLMYSDNIKYPENINNNLNKFSYNANINIYPIALNIRGTYTPQYYVSMDNIYFNRGSFYNFFSLFYKITDELSVRSLYQYVKYFPSDSSSYNRISGIINMRIPVLPEINIMADYAKYIIDRNDSKNTYFRLNTFKKFKALQLDFTFSNMNSIFFIRQDYTGFVSYTFPNYSRITLISKFIKTDTIWNKEFTTAIRWSPTKIWDIEYGTDIGERYNDKYVSEHLYSSVHMNNLSLSSNLIMRFYSDKSYINFSTTISINNGIHDFYLSTLYGRIFYDNNKNNKFDKGEKTIPNLTIILNDSIKTKTNKNGKYTFKFLPPGKYSIKLETNKLPAYFDVFKSCKINLYNLKPVVYDIPLIKTGTFSGYVFKDINKNGIKDNNEKGIPNIIVKIKDSKIYTYTDNNGFYIIGNLKPGNYIVEVPYLPDGYIFSIPNLINYVSVSKNKQEFTIDFGIIKESKPIRKKIF